MNRALNINRIILAPMEGVLDYAVRQLLTELNDFDYCVTEFIRVTHHCLTKKSLFRLCPELQHGGKTLSGTPIRVQLLGQHPQLMAESAIQAVKLGSFGIDINCGCPAKTVVGNQGGAYLLKSPELIFQITQHVRQALPKDVPVSVKVRLGWDDKSRCFEIADAVEQGGANEITIHGRTKEDGYKADRIDWHSIGLIKQKLTIPVIANGEIFSPQAAQNCILHSQTNNIMLGRGALNIPNLANMIRYNQAQLSWHHVFQLLQNYANTTLPENIDKPLYHSARIKQWLSYLKQSYPEASELLQSIRTLKTQQAIVAGLAQFLH